MDAVTFPHENVIGFIMDHMVPVRLPYDLQPYADDFNVTWTPTLLTLGSDGKEHHRTVGFLSPEQLVPSLLLGIGKYYFNSGLYSQALPQFEAVVHHYRQSDAAPEAIYMRGVSLYKEKNEPRALKEAYEKLNMEYPDSEWAKRAAPYRLIE